MEKLNLAYLEPQKARGYDFYLIPKMLIDHEAFDGIDYGAKLLYGLMLSRASLSATNAAHYTDRRGHLYIIYTVEQVMADMRCSVKTAVKMIKQLDEIGLIEKKRQGQGKPSIIYVKDFASVQFKNCKKYNSELVESTTLEVQKVQPSYNDLKENNFSKNHSIFPATDRRTESIDDEYFMEDLKERLEYGILCERRDPERVEELVNIVHDTLLAAQTKTTIYIGQIPYPSSAVKKRLESLNSEHIEDVIDSMDANTADVRNPRAYLLAALYNSPSTFSNKIHAQVLHDMPELARGRG